MSRLILIYPICKGICVSLHGMMTVTLFFIAFGSWSMPGYHEMLCCDTNQICHYFKEVGGDITFGRSFIVRSFVTFSCEQDIFITI